MDLCDRYCNWIHWVVRSHLADIVHTFVTDVMFTHGKSFRHIHVCSRARTLPVHTVRMESRYKCLFDKRNSTLIWYSSLRFFFLSFIFVFFLPFSVLFHIDNGYEKNEMVLGRTYQPPQRRPMDLAYHHLETI